MREPEALKWPLDHGANRNCTKPGRKYPDSALDFVIGTFSHSEQLAACIEILHEAGKEYARAARSAARSTGSARRKT
jgi:hypothetical protein